MQSASNNGPPAWPLEVSSDVFDFSESWDEAHHWLENLRRLVESPTDFSAQKYANCLEAEQQLFRRLPQLHALCKEARRLCRANPRISGHVAARVDRLQAAWLAVEAQLAEFAPHTGLLSVLSGDLKQLVTSRQSNNLPENAPSSTPNRNPVRTGESGPSDAAIQKDDQMQQMLSVTKSVSRLLDWICASDFLRSNDQCSLVASAQSPVAGNFFGQAQDQSLEQDPASRRRAAATSSRGEQQQQHQQLVLTTGTTTYMRTPSAASPDQQSDPTATRTCCTSAETSDLLVHAGHSGRFPCAPSAVSRDRHDKKISPSSTFSDVTRQADNHNVDGVLANSSCDTCSCSRSELRMWQPSEDSAAPGALDLPNASQLPAPLHSLGGRVAALESSLKIVQVLLQLEDQDRLPTVLNLTEAALAYWQQELDSLKDSLIALVAASAEQAIFRRAYLESLALLANWTDSLRERCRSRLLAISRTQC